MSPIFHRCFIFMIKQELERKFSYCFTVFNSGMMFWWAFRQGGFISDFFSIVYFTECIICQSSPFIGLWYCFWQYTEYNWKWETCYATLLSGIVIICVYAYWRYKHKKIYTHALHWSVPKHSNGHYSPSWRKVQLTVQFYSYQFL